MIGHFPAARTAPYRRALAPPVAHHQARGPDAEARLLRALRHAAEQNGLVIGTETIRRRPWWSATYTGTQLAVLVTAPRAPALGRWLADLPLAELPLHGHLVGSLAVDAIEDDGSTVLAALTVLVIED